MSGRQRLLFSLAVLACGAAVGLVGACAADGAEPNQSPPPDEPAEGLESMMACSRISSPR